MVPFSILIPTYNRKEKLEVVLQALAKQKGIQDGEVIVGIDGSTDGTEEWMEIQLSMVNYQLSKFRIENSGRAVIRNRLIERAQGEILLFIQDDIVVTEGWLEAHLAFHREKKGALVGRMTWYPAMPISPYMKWLESGGHMLDFSGYRNGDEMDFWHFYMGNISLPKALLGDLRFDEAVPSYGWEDILLGYEFLLKGFKVYYSSTALAYHWDEYREEDLPSYMTKVGKSAVWAEGKFPGIGIIPPFWKKRVFQLLILVGKVIWPFLSPERRWYLQMKQYFLTAVEEGALNK